MRQSHTCRQPYPYVPAGHSGRQRNSRGSDTHWSMCLKTSKYQLQAFILTLFTVASHEAGAARALPGDVIAVCAVLTLTRLNAVLPVETQRTACRTKQRDDGNRHDQAWARSQIGRGRVVTHVVCSTAPSSRPYTYTRRHKRCRTPHCGSYRFGCSWNPTDPEDTLRVNTRLIKMLEKL